MKIKSVTPAGYAYAKLENITNSYFAATENVFAHRDINFKKSTALKTEGKHKVKTLFGYMYTENPDDIYNNSIYADNYYSTGTISVKIAH